jgi:hypothetical protein
MKSLDKHLAELGRRCGIKGRRGCARRAAAVVLLGASVSADASAQATESSRSHFRDLLAEVAEAGRLPRLDSTTLADGVRREIRIYTGFGLAIPDHVVRLWEDDRGVRGTLGVFWRIGYPRWVRPEDDRAQFADFRKSDVRVRARIDSVYGCKNRTTSSRTLRVCWIDERPDRESWRDVLAKLDHLNVESIQMPVEPKTGFDGWMMIVEVRTRVGYRMYRFWNPDSTSTQPGKRAAARMAAVVGDEFRRRRAK